MSPHDLPRPNSSRALVAFILLFVALFLAVGLIDGIGAPALPPGKVAVIEGAPKGLDEINESEFNRALKWRAEEAQLSDVPRPGDEKYDELRNAAMGDLLGSVWIQGEAEAMGLEAPHRQITREIRASSSIRYLRERGSTGEEIEASARLEVLKNEIEDALEAPVLRAWRGKVAAAELAERIQEAFIAWDAQLQSKWQLRTRCAEGFVMEKCSNSPPFIHTAPPACYEADPETPPEGCPAPVTQPQPILPGSVTRLRPQGKRFPQRPYPEALPPQ